MIPTRFREIIKHITTFLILLSSACNKTMLKNRQKPQKRYATRAYLSLFDIVVGSYNTSLFLKMR
ncbi:hypothetical protein SAMN05421737_103200 [Shouchella lonarensis]|uniref:Uncharacterized protein n=1 Tax=Shouchella lonarensis TaxID=1464122 RepID=A0A1G6HD99_9BACI|nr:hypothetical protein SAMN05421737_103200 [Shouchella lonarensis]